MKKFVCGAEFMSGLNKDTGKPFGFGKVGVGNEVEEVNNPKFSLFGAGVQIGNRTNEAYLYGASLDVVKQIVALHPPCYMDVEFAPSSFGNGEKLDIVGVKPFLSAVGKEKAA